MTDSRKSGRFEKGAERSKCPSTDLKGKSAPGETVEGREPRAGGLLSEMTARSMLTLAQRATGTRKRTRKRQAAAGRLRRRFYFKLKFEPPVALAAPEQRIGSKGQR